jgi:hypothetical protein
MRASKPVRTNPLRNTTRKRATKTCLFCATHPNRISDFRLAPGSFNSKLENLILNHIPTIADMRI